MATDPNRVKEIFLEATEQQDAAARAAFLDRACGDDVGLRDRVDALLRSHDPAGSFLANPAASFAEPNGATQELGNAGSPPPKDQTLAFNADGDDAVADNKTNSPASDDGDTDDLTFLSPSTRPDSLGRIGHYEMLQVLGKGGFGIVFRAFDDVLQRVVAVKVMAPQIATLSPARKRFLREARSSAAVRHENVVHVYEVGEQPLPYLVMEFVPGETLQQKLDRSGPLDVPEVLWIGRQVAEGLAAAHASDLIHRDIKPGNILLEGGSHKVKVTDFGLARAADDASISQSGVIAGTPMFMAPEQALGHKIDQRADLFSLGSVLYQMASGRPPFRAPSALAVLKRVAEEPPRPIAEIIPETPAWLCGIIAKLHAKNPADRFQSAREVADLLADCEAKLKAKQDVRNVFPAARDKPAGWTWITATIAVVVALFIPGFPLAMLELNGVTHLFRPQATSEPIKPGGDPTPPIDVANLGAPPRAVAPFNAAKAQEHQEAWAKHLGIDVETTNSIGMKLRLIPPGKFVIHPNLGLAPERTSNELNDPFCAGMHEVTVGQFRQFVAETAYKTAAELDPHLGEKAGVGRDNKYCWNHRDFASDERLPVACITWHDGMAFCRWLSKKENRTYRLPTEAEWIWLARAGSPDRYFFGNEEAQLEEFSWHSNPAAPRVRAMPVGQKRPNPWGLYDVHGNVGELCFDWLSPDHQHRLTIATQPNGPGPQDRLLQRGGGYFDGPDGAGFGVFWNVALSHIGFRVVMIGDLRAQTPPVAVAPPTPVPAPSERRTIDLLAIMDAKKDATKSEWSIVAKGLNSPATNVAVVEFPYSPPDEYDFRIEFTCVSGRPEVNQFLSRRDRSFSCLLGAVRTTFGLEYVDGKSVGDNATSTNRVPMAFKERHVSIASIRNDRVTIELDGKELVNWKTNYSDLSLDGRFKHWATARSNRALLAVGTRLSEVIFHKAEVVEITGQGKFSRPNDPAVLAGKWKLGGTPAPVAINTKPLPPKFKNSIGMEFVIVPNGKAWLGGDKDKLGDKEVEIPADFYLGKYEVTQEEWERVMGENPSSWSRRGEGKDAVKGITDADLKRFPVENVSWDQCQLFIAKLSKLEKETGWIYRLPTLAEWEYACRGGPMLGKMDSGFDFYFYKPTNTLTPERANIDRGFNRPRNVGSYEPNRLGLFDMHGNVAEWCSDIRKGEGPKRYLRGGCFFDESRTCRAQFIGMWQASLRGNMVGLRLARVPSGAPSPEAKTPVPDTKPPNEVAQSAPTLHDTWLKALAVLPVDRQGAALAAKMKEQRPGFEEALLKAIATMSPDRQAIVVDVWLKERKPAFSGVEDAWFKALPAMPAGAQATLVNAWLRERKPAFVGFEDAWLKTLPAMPADTQVVLLTAWLKERNPGFDGAGVAHKAEGNVVTVLEVPSPYVQDLFPLRALSGLKALTCRSTVGWDHRAEGDAAILKSLTLLQTVNGKPVTQFWKETLARAADFKEWLQLVPSLDAKGQAAAVEARLKQHNPGSDLKVSRKIEEGMVTELAVSLGDVADISPVRALVGLKSFTCDQRAGGRLLRDLSPLKGLKQLTSVSLLSTPFTDLSQLKDLNLTALSLGNLQVSDLTPLKDMKLTSFSCSQTIVTDLAPLKDMKLTSLHFSRTKVTDLTPLQGMPLAVLAFHTTGVKDLMPLKDMPLTDLFFQLTGVADLTPLTGMPLARVYCWGTQVTDLSPLKGMQLEEIRLTPRNITKGLDILRDMKSLKTIGIGPANTQVWPAAEFWERYDKGEFK